MADKYSFFENINSNTIFDEEFFKKVYAYSICDNNFLTQVAIKLKDIGCKEVINQYNTWLTTWNYKDEQMMKTVARWYVTECNKYYVNKKNEGHGTEVIDWKHVKIGLLRKKRELLKMKLQQSIVS